MALRKEHEIHKRRSGRNIGVGVLLAAFVVLILALTMVKVTSNGFSFPDTQAEQN
jgi:ABC-type transporter Mla subunit MlaD